MDVLDLINCEILDETDDFDFHIATFHLYVAATSIRRGYFYIDSIFFDISAVVVLIMISLTRKLLNQVFLALSLTVATITEYLCH